MLKITAISDTHCYHERIKLGGGDILIHAGDISSVGRKEEIEHFIRWFESQDYKYKVFIAGNHDKSFDPKFYKPLKGDKKPVDPNAKNWIKEIIDNFHSNPNNFYLENTGCTINNINFWGSPITPWFHGNWWAFNKLRGEEIKKIWDLIPTNTDILITHGPAHMKLDRVLTFGSENYGEYVGCADLLRRIQEIKPKIHISGHIHEGYGHEYKDGTEFINASILSETYAIKNKPINFEINEESKEITFL